MTKTQELLELAERCEKATGPDAYLDLDIHRTVEHDPRAELGDAGDYTMSLDAAMTLLGDCEFFFKRVPTYAPPCRACVWVDGRNVGYDADAATPALALCAAALRARSAA